MYNSDGIRTQKKLNNVVTEYVLEGSKVVATIMGSLNTYFVYDTNGSPIGMHVTAGTTAPSTANAYFFVKNLQGDILKVVDANGNDIVTYEYDPWGKVISEEIAPGK